MCGDEFRDEGGPLCLGSNDPMAAVRLYIDAFNTGDAKAMAAVCSDLMQILDGMAPHVWQGPTATEDWFRDVLTEGEHLGASGYHITLDEPRHVDVTDNHAYTAPVWPVSGSPTGFPVAASHSRTVWSAPPEAMRVPSGPVQDV